MVLLCKVYTKWNKTWRYKDFPSDISRTLTVNQQESMFNYYHQTMPEFKLIMAEYENNKDHCKGNCSISKEDWQPKLRKLISFERQLLLEPPPRATLLKRVEIYVKTTHRWITYYSHHNMTSRSARISSSLVRIQQK